MSTELERAVIDCARLVHLGWMGDGVDGGAAMRVAMKKLGMAFTSLDESPPCFTTPRISFETPDARVCRRCDRKAYEHVEVAGIGLVCPVQVTTFTPDTR